MRGIKTVKTALILAICINIFNLLFFFGGTFAELVFLFNFTFKGILNIFIFMVILVLSIKGLEDPKNRPIAIISIILGLVSLWTVAYLAPYMWFGAPLFQF